MNIIDLKGKDYSGQTYNGDFHCSNNRLTSLKDGPEYVQNDFYCHRNNLTSLEGAPKEVGGSFYCFENNLTSLKGGPQKIGEDFDIRGNKKLSLKEIGRYIMKVTINGECGSDYDNSVLNSINKNELKEAIKEIFK